MRSSRTTHRNTIVYKESRQLFTTDPLMAILVQASQQEESSRGRGSGQEFKISLLRTLDQQAMTSQKSMRVQSSGLRLWASAFRASGLNLGFENSDLQSNRVWV